MQYVEMCVCFRELYIKNFKIKKHVRVLFLIVNHILLYFLFNTYINKMLHDDNMMMMKLIRNMVMIV